jgi:hypothetical protein
MDMAFTYNKSTNETVYKIRLKIQDIDSTSYDFEDEQLMDFHTEGGTINSAGALSLESLASRYSKQAFSKSFGSDLSYNYTSIAANLRKQAQLLRDTDSEITDNPFGFVSRTEED